MSATPPPTTIPQKRPAPADSLDPAPKKPTKPTRTKTETWRKKDSSASALSHPPSAASGTTPTTPSRPGLVRYRLPAPQFTDYYGHRAPPFQPTPPGPFGAITDHPMNRRGFRYTPCEASRLLPALAYRSTEYPPFSPRVNFEDMNATVLVTADGAGVTNPKGWRMARANVGVREGDWYYEARITSGIPAADGDGGQGDGDGGHVRLGFARREAPLDAPVGFDAYSYGLRDQGCQKVHLSRPKEFCPDETFVVGDIVGFHISLPSLDLQRSLSGDVTVKSGDVIRDRLPIRFRNQLWFENFEYQPTREMEELMNPTAGDKGAGEKGGKESGVLRTLPGSFIRVYRNGRYIGTPFEDLYAFLPPASKPLPAVGGRELDDGTLGYYPAASCFKGGAVELNFGPSFWQRPEELGEGVRGMCERYEEQIAEDVVWDIVDEIDLSFVHGGTRTQEEGGIKEMVMEDE